MKNIRVSSILIVLVLYGIVPGVCIGSSQDDGAKLYKKHCISCHPDDHKLRSSRDIIFLMRNPPVVMPVFGVEKLSDYDAQAIADFISSSTLSECPRSEVTFPVLSTAVGTVTTPVTDAPAPANVEPKKSLKDDVESIRRKDVLHGK